MSSIGSEFVTHHNRNIGGQKVLYLPLNGAIKQTGMEDAFLSNNFLLTTLDFCGCHKRYGTNVLNRLFLNLAETVKPDWIHMQLQYRDFVDPLTLDRIKHILPHTVITNWSGDIRQAPMPCFVKTSQHIDLTLMSNEGQLAEHLKCGAKNVEYWQIGIDPKIFHPLDINTRNRLKTEYNHNVVFCGGNYGKFPGSKERFDVISGLKKVFGDNFGLYGEFWPQGWHKGILPFCDQNLAYNASKIVINVNNFNYTKMYFSDRQLVGMASGAMMICHYIPGLEIYFQNGIDLAWFHSTDECVDLVRHYLEKLEELEAIGARGSKKVLTEHSYHMRVKELSERLKQRGML